MKIAVIDPSCFTMYYDHYLCEALIRHGCEVDFIGSRHLHGDGNFEIHYHKVDFFYNVTNSIYHNHTSGFLRKELKGFEHVIEMNGLVDYLRRSRPTVIHFQWLPFPLVDHLFVDIFRNYAPVVLTVHDVFPYHNAPSSRIQLMNFYSILRKPDHLIVHTRSSLKILCQNLRVPESSVSIVPHGIFDHYFRQVCKEGTPGTEKQSIVFWGAIKPYKGLEVLIHAYARLPKDIQGRAKLVIAGKPRMNTNHLKALAEKLGIAQHTEWHLRFIPEEEVGRLLGRATVFVLPYQNFEAQSGALMAMLPFGKPIIASRISCFEEILQDRVHGLLFEPNNPTALAEALQHSLADARKRASMGEAVKKLAQEVHSWDYIANETVRIYENLVSR